MEMTQKLGCEDQLDQDQKHECDQSKQIRIRNMSSNFSSLREMKT